MATDLSKNSADQVLFLITSSNANVPITFDDITFGAPAVGTGEKNTELTVTAKANTGYVGSVDVEYDRLDLDGFTTYGPASVTIPVGGTVNDVVSEFNLLYGANLDFTDIPNDFDISGVNYAGVPVTIAALSTSLAYQGSIDVIVKLASVNLNTVIVNTPISGLEFPPLPQFITFNQPNNYDYDEIIPTLTITSTSALPVELSSTTPAVCGVDGVGNVSFITAGVCSILAEQDGDDDYLPATPVSRSFNINPIPPNAPSNVLGYGGSNQVALRFTHPSYPTNTGGVPILSYTAVSTPGGFTGTSAMSPLVVAGLAEETEYTFVVKATNVAGDSVFTVETAPMVTLEDEFYPPYTWAAMPQGLNSGGPATTAINKFITDDKGTILALLASAYAARSDDNGLTWSPAVRGLNNAGTTTQGLTQGATDGKGVWIVGNSNGFCSRSVDNGVTWTLMPRGLSSGASANGTSAIVTDKKGVWIAAFAAGWVSRSTDNGATWTALPRYLDYAGQTPSYTALATDENGVWVASGSNGYATRSTDNGLTWTPLEKGLNTGNVAENINQLVTDCLGYWIAVGVAGYCSRSTNNGLTWTGLPRGFGIAANSNPFIATDKQGRWMVVGGVFALSTDNGLSFTRQMDGLNSGNTSQTGLAVVTDGHGSWFVGQSSGWASRGRPNFAIEVPNSFSVLPAGLNVGSVSFRLNSMDTDTNGTWVVVASGGYAARSTDNGLTWTALTKGLNSGNVSANFQAVGTDRNNVWVALGSGGDVRSTDNGATWTPLPAGLGNAANTTYQSIATDGNGVWVTVGNSGLASRSIDNGVSWTPLTAGLNSGNPTAAFSEVRTDKAGVWVAVSSTGWSSRSTDNGATWTALVQGLNSGNAGANFTSLATNRAGVWFAVSTSGVVGKSTDNGATWSAGIAGLNSGNTGTSFSVIVSDSKTAWLASSSDGYSARSIDNGVTWTTVAKGMYTGNVSAELFAAATDEKGVWVFGGMLGSARITR